MSISLYYITSELRHKGWGVLIIPCPFYLQDPVTEYYKTCKAAQLLLSGL